MPSMPKVRDSSGTIGTTRLPIFLSLQQDVEDAHEGHGGRHLATVAGGLEQRVEGRERRYRQRLGLAPALRQVAAERLAMLAHVLEFGRVFGELQVGQLLELVVRYRQVEAVAEGLERVVPIFFCWWVMFCASPDSPMP